MKYLSLNRHNKIIIIGFGSIGPAVLPLILKSIDINPSQIEIISAGGQNKALAEQMQIKFEVFKLTPTNYRNFLSARLKKGDILLNLTVNVSSIDIITITMSSYDNILMHLSMLITLQRG